MKISPAVKASKKSGEWYICPICNTQFYVFPSEIKRAKEGKRSQRTYCSRECAGKAIRGRANPQWKPKIQRVCPICGKTFLIYPVRVRQGRGIYCSRECAAKARRNPIEEKQCAICGKKLNSQQTKYCSQECRSKGLLGSNNSQWKSKVKRNCLICGKEFHITPAVASYGQGICCSRECYAKARGRMALVKGYSTCHGGKREDLGGLYVRSGWEANYCRYLNWLQEKGKIEKWEYEADTFEFPIKRGSRFYTPDFKVFQNDGTLEYHEVKGYMDQQSATKLKRMARYYPDIIIKVVDKKVYRDIANLFMELLPNWEKNKKHAC